MPSKYYSPPASLGVGVLAQSATINTGMSGVDQGFGAAPPGTGVLQDIVKALSHATLTIGQLTATALAMAGKLIAFDATGLNLTVGATYGIWRGTWIIGTPYNAGDVLLDTAIPFGLLFALKAFVSGASVAADVAAGNLQRVGNFVGIPYQLPVTVLNPPLFNNFLASNNAYVLVGAVNAVLVLPANPSDGDVITISIPGAYTGTVDINAAFSKLNTASGTQRVYAATGAIHGITLYFSATNSSWIVTRSY